MTLRVSAARFNRVCRNALKVVIPCLLVALAVPAGADEPIAHRQDTVSFVLQGEKIVGTFTIPENQDPMPVVLMLHGAGGRRQGPPIRGASGGLFQRAAQVFAQEGIASLSISTRGRGGSDGDFYDMTFERRIDEARAAVDWLAARGDIDKDRIGVLGHSQGTIIAAAVAGRLAGDRPIAAAVLWAPNADPLRTYRNSMGPAVLEKGLRAKPGEIVRWRGAGGTVRAFRSGFFHGLIAISTLKEIEAYRGPLLVVTGLRDRLSPPANARVIGRHHTGNHSFVEFDVGHRMGASTGPAEVDAIARHTARWLKANGLH